MYINQWHTRMDSSMSSVNVWCLTTAVYPHGLCYMCMWIGEQSPMCRIVGLISNNMNFDIYLDHHGLLEELYLTM